MTTNCVVIIGIMIDWMGNMWNLHERVLSVKELHETHGGAHIPKVLHEVLVDYN